MNTASFYITCGTIVLLLLMVIYIATAKNKKILHYLLLVSILAMFIWNSAMILRGIFQSDLQSYIIFENITYIGSALVPVMLILIGIAYAQPEKGVRKWHYLLFVVPVVTQIILWTNDSHHLFTGDFVMRNGEFAPLSYGIYAYNTYCIFLYMYCYRYRVFELFCYKEFWCLVGTGAAYNNRQHNSFGD